MAIAGTFSGQRAAELLEQARSSFEQAFVTMAGAASLAVLAALVTIAVISRRQPAVRPVRHVTMTVMIRNLSYRPAGLTWPADETWSEHPRGFRRYTGTRRIGHARRLGTRRPQPS